MAVADVPVLTETHPLIEELLSLSGKAAVVVGGGGVLAGEMAMGLAGAGADVVIADLNEENARREADAIRGLGRKSLAYAADVTRKTELQGLLEATLSHFGHIDIVLNAAGINSGTPFFEIEEKEWDGSWTSTCAGDGRRGHGRVDHQYAVAKGGVNQITKYLANEFAPFRVRVNAILPGFLPAEQNRKILTQERVDSIMRHTPMRRFGKPSELVAATLYLASEKASSFVTGSIVRVDGGFGAMTI